MLMTLMLLGAIRRVASACQSSHMDRGVLLFSQGACQQHPCQNNRSQDVRLFQSFPVLVPLFSRKREGGGGVCQSNQLSMNTSEGSSVQSITIQPVVHANIVLFFDIWATLAVLFLAPQRKGLIGSTNRERRSMVRGRDDRRVSEDEGRTE